MGKKSAVTAVRNRQARAERYCHLANLFAQNRASHFWGVSFSVHATFTRKRKTPYKVVEDTRSEGSVGGYLHIGRLEDGDVSADEVTDKVRDVMVKYFYYHGSIVTNNF